MRARVACCLLIAAATLVAPASASALFAHVVTPGESLSSVAATDGLSVDQLAAVNGISSGSQLVAGTTLLIPPQAESSFVASAPGVGAQSGSSAAGAYVVRPGDTLWAIAARSGTTVGQLAAANGVDPSAPLLAGAILRVGGGASSQTQEESPVANSQPVGAAAEGSPLAAPYPTDESVTPSLVAQVAAENGVPPTLADAVAAQESGFNNGLVSTADARGVMQILPGTWNWIQRDLTAGAPLAPASAYDNVRGGVLLLRSLLQATGGDPALTAAGYYQGLPSVRRNGVYPSTQQYVNSVLERQRQFGGG